MNVGDVRAGLVAALEVIPDLSVFGYQPSSVTLPAAVVDDPSVEYDLTQQHGFHALEFGVRVLVSDVVDRASTDAINEYMSHPHARSVKSAVQNDQTLGGVCDVAKVTSGVPSVLESDDGVVRVVEFVVLVWSRGK